jgi:hypothetical protein
MPGLVPGIHDFFLWPEANLTKKTWMLGTGPSMTR